MKQKQLSLRATPHPTPYHHQHTPFSRCGLALLCCAVTVMRALGQEGAVDGSFQSPLFDLAVPLIAVETDGRVLCGYTPDAIHYSIKRLTSTGAADAPLNLGDGPESITAAIDVGTLHIPGATNAASITVVKPLPNGQILVAGTFSHFNKVARKLLVRLNQDGSVDPSFNTSNGFQGSDVSNLVLADAGKIYAGGKFTKFGASTRNVGLVRLNEDGTLDASFVDGTISFGANATGLSLQPDGKPLIDAAYANSSFQATMQVYRLGANGGLDAGFFQATGTPVATGPLKHASLPSGQILVTGGTTVYNGASVNNALFRLNTDGTLDTGFVGLTLGLSNVGGYIGRFMPTPSGSVYISGAFDTVNGQPRHSLARLKPDGTLDPNFAPEAYISPSPGALALQPDGKILACAIAPTTTGAKYQIIRLNGSGNVPVERPTLGGLTLLGGGTNQIQVGIAGTVVVQGTTDLTNWQAILTNSAPGGGALKFVDPFASQSNARFYRLLAIP